MKEVTLTVLGSQLGIAVPKDYVRVLGWVRGDKLVTYIQDGDVIMHNPAARAVKFTREFQSRREANLESDTR